MNMVMVMVGLDGFGHYLLDSPGERNIRVLSSSPLFASAPSGKVEATEFVDVGLPFTCS
jgi:hypothetical protein